MAGMRTPLTVAQAQARIKTIEEAIRMAKEYLESGAHVHSKAFRPIFTPKYKDGKELPPHKDWVRHVYLRHMEKQLSQTEKRLWQLDRESNTPSAHE
jgi:hypothetical protein